MMRFALALLDMMSAGVFAGALVQIALRRTYVRIPQAWIYATLAIVFTADRVFMPDNAYASAVVAAVAAAAIVNAIARARSEPFATLLVLVPSMVILAIVLAGVYDPNARESLRALIAPLFTVPAIAGIGRLLYLYGKRYRAV